MRSQGAAVTVARVNHSHPLEDLLAGLPAKDLQMFIFTEGPMLGKDETKHFNLSGGWSIDQRKSSCGRG